jgi:hypothetical protein
MSDIQNSGSAQDVVDPDAEVPTTCTGTVTRIPRDQIDICMDGAKFLLATTTADGEETVRLKPVDDRAEKVLDRAAGTGNKVTVTGYLRHVECTRLDVFQAEPVREHGRQHA